MSLTIPTLRTTIEEKLGSVSGTTESVAQTVGNFLTEAEKTLILAYSTKSGDDQLKTLKDALGMDPKSEATVESLQILAKSRYEKAMQSFNMIMQLLSNAHQNIMNIIQAIRAR